MDAPSTMITLGENKASIVLGDLLSMVQDESQQDALEHMDISFTCKSCKVKKSSIKDLVAHLSSGECKQTSLSNGQPARKRGRPPKALSKGSQDWDAEYKPRPDVLEATLNQPTSTGRQTRISSGAIKRKSVLETLRMGLKEEEETNEVTGTVAPGAVQVRRGRGRPRKYPIVLPISGSQNSSTGPSAEENLSDALVPQGESPVDESSMVCEESLEGEAATGAKGETPDQVQHESPSDESVEPILEEIKQEKDVVKVTLDCSADGPGPNEQYPGDKTLVIKLVPVDQEPEEDDDLAAMVTQEELSDDEPVTVVRVNKKRNRWYTPRASSQHQLKKYKCSKCHHRAFPTEAELDIHEQTHFNEDPNAPDYFKCIVCDYSNRTWARMLIHLITHDDYKKVFENSSVMANILGSFQCSVCSKKFDRKSNLMQHYRFVHMKQGRFCQVCQKQLGSMDEKTFARHLDKCKNILLQCSECDYVTNVRASMKLHQRIHSGKGLTCQICQAVFPTKQRYESHCLTHMETRPRFICETCGADFASSDAVKKHVARFHSGILSREWQCDQCSYKGKLEYDLKKHIQQVHNKKFKCSLCPFGTNIESVFHKHQEYHGPDRVCPCPYNDCYYSGCTPQQLADHVSQVHNLQYKNQCPVCQKHFKKKTTLLRHLITHTKSQPYFCAECGEKFYTHTAYYRHRHKTRHDAKREGVVSVPQNIFIQYKEELTQEPPVQIGSSGDVEGLIRQANQEAARAEKVRQEELVHISADPMHFVSELPSTYEVVPSAGIKAENEEAAQTSALASILTAPQEESMSYGSQVIEVPIVNSSGVPQNVNVVTTVEEDGNKVPDDSGAQELVIEADELPEGSQDVTFVLQVEEGQEQFVMNEQQVMEHLGGNQVVFQGIQNLVEMEEGGEEYAVVMLPSESSPGDEPEEAALSMLQLQSGSSSSQIIQ